MLITRIVVSHHTHIGFADLAKAFFGMWCMKIICTIQFHIMKFCESIVYSS